MPFDASPQTDTTVADVLRRARALIDSPEKWWRPSWENAPGNPACVANAICHANGELLFVEAHNVMCRALGLDRVPEIWHWNDAPERTHAEVLAAFDKAIELAERGAR